MIRITRDWINRVGHPQNGAWNAAQLLVLGIIWPPKKGWIEEILGRLISVKQKAQIEAERLRSFEREVEKKIDHQRRQEEVYYTWPDGKGSWTGSAVKPDWWDLSRRIAK